MASSAPTLKDGESQVSTKIMSDEEFSGWVDPECFNLDSLDSNYDELFPQIMPTGQDATTSWGSGWRSKEDWHGFDSFFKPAPTEVKVEDLPAAIIEPVEAIALELAHEAGPVVDTPHKTEVSLTCSIVDQYKLTTRQNSLLDLRQKLHKGLLTKTGRKECQMSEMSSLLYQLEHLESPSREDIQTTKTDKLLMAIKRQKEIPKEDEFKLKERATELLQKWESILKTRVQRISATTVQSRAGRSTKPLMTYPTESCESGMSFEILSCQTSGDESVSLVVKPDFCSAEPSVIDMSESCELVVISDISHSQTKDDSNGVLNACQGSRATSLLINGMLSSIYLNQI
jgi:hypothetical protein